jgi:hypothetical protein
MRAQTISRVQPQEATAKQRRGGQSSSGHLLWVIGPWRCEYCIVNGRAVVRLHHGPLEMSSLEEGPPLDLRRQVEQWRREVAALMTAATRRRSEP